MTWVQVECGNGTRYAAPSHGRPLPNLSGASQLFQQPLGFRHLQTFEINEANYAADVDGCCNEGVAVTVLTDKRDLGGYFGVTTVTVGGENVAEGFEGDEENGAYVHGAISSLQESMHLQALRLFMERVFAVLANTNDRGVTLLLDALCTRAPLPLTAEAASRAATVREDDGGPYVTTELSHARAQLPNSEAVPKEAGRRSNRRFLEQLTQSGAASSSRTDGRLFSQLLPPNALMEALKPQQLTQEGESPARAYERSLPLSYATATRRRSFLFFVEHNIVPLSVLYTHVQYVEVAKRRAHVKHPAADAVCSGTDGLRTNIRDTTADATHAASSQAFLNEIMSHFASTTSDTSPETSSVINTHLSCTSPLRRRSSRALEKDITWATVAQTAEESGQLLLLSVFRLLTYQPVNCTDASAMKRILLKEMWEVCTPSQSTSSPPPLPPFLVPMVAAFSPSGLLTASASYRRCLTHDEHMLLSAAAIDRLTRFRSSSFSDCAPVGNKYVCCGDVLRWTSWPMRIAEPTRQIIDVLLLTIGDALAFCLCFSRTSASINDGETISGVNPASPAVTAALSFQGVQQLLERVVADAGGRTPVTLQSDTTLNTSLLDSLVYACTHSTRPYTPAFHDALFVTTEVESALGLVYGDVKGGSLTSGLTQTSFLEANAAVAAELHYLLHSRQQEQEQKQQTKSSKSNISSIPGQQQPSALHNSPSAVVMSSTTAPASAAASATKSLGSLHKLYACLPLRKRTSSSRSKAAQPSTAVEDSTADFMQQSAVHVQHMDQSGIKGTGKQRAASEQQKFKTARTAVLLAIPLECMLCFVAAVVTRNEFGALRSMRELGLHSFFFLQQSAVPQVKSEGVNLPDSPFRSTGTASPGVHMGRKKKKLNTALNSSVLTAPRFGVSFARLCLQQPQCPYAILPEEWVDVEGTPDCQGGRFTFIEDPTLTLSPAVKLLRNLAYGHTAQLPSAVTTVPYWSILHVAPMEPNSLLKNTSSSYPTRQRNDDTNSLCNSFSSIADYDGVSAGCPASLHEDAQLLTSFSFVVPQKLHRRSASVREAGGITGRSSSSHVAPTQPCSAGVAPPLRTESAVVAVPSLFLCQNTKESRAGEVRWANVAAVVNICGNIVGAKAHALVHALQKRALSAAEKAASDGKKNSYSRKYGAVAGVPVDSGPAEFEYAADTSGKMKELYRKVALCQEAALLLLEAASCD